jgi:ElaB/YqjD/DUF883 family membrane-anchored ribosome-binding protein
MELNRILRNKLHIHVMARNCFHMQNEKSFPASRRDIDNLRQTASDAAADLSSTASVHVSKARGQLSDLAGHAQEEGTAHLNQVRDSLADVVESAREYATARPLATIGIAVGVGFLLGIIFRGHSRE